jgi:hypothetical protein
MKYPRFLFEKSTSLPLPASWRTGTGQGDVAALTGVGEEEEAVSLAGTKAMKPVALANFTERYLPLPHFKPIKQAKTNWCWAAVSAAVENCYNGGEMPTGQAGIASRTLPLHPSCFERLNDTCDVMWDLAAALGRHFATLEEAPTAIGELHQEINEGRRPICVGINWYGRNTKHFAAICGIDPGAPGGPVLYVMDPYRGEIKSFSYQGFPNNCFPNSIWDRTYFTQG